jgi:hypothetical protein
MSMLFLTLLAAHEGEEFAIILPAVMLAGAFFILRWANKKDDGDDDAAEELLPDERPVGLVLPPLKTGDAVSLSGAVPSAGRPDGDETTR